MEQKVAREDVRRETVAKERDNFHIRVTLELW
jgi:hypothetical protein